MKAHRARLERVVSLRSGVVDVFFAGGLPRMKRLPQAGERGEVIPERGESRRHGAGGKYVEETGENLSALCHSQRQRAITEELSFAISGFGARTTGA